MCSVVKGGSSGLDLRSVLSALVPRCVSCLVGLFRVVGVSLSLRLLIMLLVRWY